MSRSYELSFNYKGKKYDFYGTLRSCLGSALDFILENGFKFKKTTSLLDSPQTKEWIDGNPTYSSYLRGFHHLKDGKYYWIGGNARPAFLRIRRILVDFGIDESSIKSNFFETGDEYKVKKYEEVTSPDQLGEVKKNPFRQSICVLGKSGRGKTVTVENILQSIPSMEYEFLIPTASTTNLLAQYSPASSRYIPSRLGKMIMKAHNNPTKLFTVVFDECHKSNVIEMINDELLQCISLYRNKGKRFISLDDETSSLYEGLTTQGGNLLIPDNFGFIFLSSKPDVIIQNSDFFNRVDICVLVKQPKGHVTFDDTNYFVPIGNRTNGMKTAEDEEQIRDLNEAN